MGISPPPGALKSLIVTDCYVVNSGIFFGFLTFSQDFLKRRSVRLTPQKRWDVEQFVVTGTARGSRRRGVQAPQLRLLRLRRLDLGFRLRLGAGRFRQRQR